MTSPSPGRATGLAAALALAAALLAGCSDGGVDTDCSLSECTLTFDRGVEASTRVLGISVELVSATDGEATVAVAGRQATVPVEGSREVSGLTVTVRSLTSDEVVLHVTR